MANPPNFKNAKTGLDASFTHRPLCVRMDIEKEAVFKKKKKKS